MIIKNRVNFADWFNQHAPDDWAAKSVSTSTVNFCSIGRVYQKQVKWLWITRQKLAFEPVATYLYYNSIEVSAVDWAKHADLLSELIAGFEDYTCQTITVNIDV